MLIKRFSEQSLVHEYGLDGVRTFPWQEVVAPFGAGYCIVAPHSATLDHVNEPADEDELFIVILGSASIVVGDETFEVSRGDQVFIPRGKRHHVRNGGDSPFHFYMIWWNAAGVDRFRAERA